MEKKLYDMIVKSAKSEGMRLRIEAFLNRNRPLDATSRENTRYHVEIDFQNGAVNLTRSFGYGVPQWIAEGGGTRFELSSSTSLVSLAALLEDRPDVLADIVVGDADERLRAEEQAKLELADLPTFWAMDESEWFSGAMPTGSESDDALMEMVVTVTPVTDALIFPGFTKEEAFDWLKDRRDERREELAEAARESNDKFQEVADRLNRLTDAFEKDASSQVELLETAVTHAEAEKNAYLDTVTDTDSTSLSLIRGMNRAISKAKVCIDRLRGVEPEWDLTPFYQERISA